MRVLVATASRHGSTTEIAEEIAAALRRAIRVTDGVVDVRAAQEVTTVGGYDVADLVRKVGAREHRLFAGKLGKKQLRFTERAVVAALRAPEGDFRDWTAIAAWAQNIGSALAQDRGSPAPPTTSPASTILETGGAF